MNKSFWLEFIRTGVLCFIMCHRPKFILSVFGIKALQAYHAFLNTRTPDNLGYQPLLVEQYDTNLWG